MKSLLIGLLFLSAIPASGQEFSMAGIMHHSTLEGGCWYLQGDDGKRYELIGDQAIVNPLHAEGEHIVVRAVTAKGVASICMMGEIIRVLARTDSVRYPIDPLIAPMTITGTVHRTKEGVWYVKTPKGLRYRFKNPPEKKFRHVGASIDQKFRVLLDGRTSPEHMNGLILSDTMIPEPKGLAKQRTSDPR
jgi:hypothetical protein